MILATGRLTLRPVEAADIEALHEHWEHPLVRSHLFDNEPVLPDLVARLVGDSHRDFAERGYGLWALVPDSAVAGVCGLRDRPPVTPVPRRHQEVFSHARHAVRDRAARRLRHGDHP